MTRWTPEMKQILQRMYEAGESARDIATALYTITPVDRQSVLNKARKMGLRHGRGIKRKPADISLGGRHEVRSQTRWSTSLGHPDRQVHDRGDRTTPGQ